MRSDKELGIVRELLPTRTAALSKITIGAIQDLGLQVDYSTTDNFPAAEFKPGCACRINRGRALSKIEQDTDTRSRAMT
jgi:hypothetical protein